MRKDNWTCDREDLHPRGFFTAKKQSEFKADVTKPTKSLDGMETFCQYQRLSSWLLGRCNLLRLGPSRDSSKMSALQRIQTLNWDTANVSPDLLSGYSCSINLETLPEPKKPPGNVFEITSPVFHLNCGQVENKYIQSGFIPLLPGGHAVHHAVRLRRRGDGHD